MNASNAVQAKPDLQPWLAHYPTAVPPQIGDAGTLVDLIGGAFETYAERPAFESFGKAISFAETAAAARAFVGWLQS